MSVRDKNLKKFNGIEDFISKRDFTGAIAFLQVWKNVFELFVFFFSYYFCNSFVERTINKYLISIFGSLLLHFMQEIINVHLK